MNSIVITPKNKDELRFLRLLLKKLGYKTKEITDSELEDAGLLASMVSEKNEDYVSEEEVMKGFK